MRSRKSAHRAEGDCCPTILAASGKLVCHLSTRTSIFLISVNALGIESLSRGAKGVVFIENYQNVLSILKKNIESLKLFEKSKILEKDIYNFKTLSELNQKFDVIFLDPPYKDNKIKKLLIMYSI